MSENTKPGDKPEQDKPPGLPATTPQSPPQVRASSHGEIKSPREWFNALAPDNETATERTSRMAQHNAAAAAHGWKQHRHHEGKSMQLSEADYLAALKGVASGLGRKGIHTPALSPHAGKRI